MVSYTGEHCAIGAVRKVGAIWRVKSEYNYLNVVDVLLIRVPELRPVYQQVLEDEGLPVPQYGVFSRSARFAQQLAARSSNDPAVEDMLRRLMAMLEEMVASDDQYLHDLMGAGFVEAMNPDAPRFDYLVKFMGPASRAMVAMLFGSGAV